MVEIGQRKFVMTVVALACATGLAAFGLLTQPVAYALVGILAVGCGSNMLSKLARDKKE
jgi:hypothetical protein